MILLGHVTDRLREMQDESVHCVCTSIPYWGLRDYGTPPVIFGEDPDCDHVWGDLGAMKHGRKQGSTGQRADRDTTGTATVINASKGSTCGSCGAWRGQLGLEPTPRMFVDHIVEIFREVRRVLRSDGTLWLNCGDSYATGAGSAKNPGGRCRGSRRPGQSNGKQTQTVDLLGFPETQPNRMPIEGIPCKSLLGMPWRVAFGLQDDGWVLRNEIIWYKPNAMPESVGDRCPRDHEQIFLFTKSRRYFFDAEAVKVAATGSASGNKLKRWGANHTTLRSAGSGVVERHGSIPHPGSESRKLRTVWKISSKPLKEKHFAAFPPEIPMNCIKAGTSEKGCCPKCGTPWRRIVERVRVPTRPGKKTKLSVDRQSGEYVPLNGKPWAAAEVGNRDPQRHITDTKTVGWEPCCQCGEPEAVPCVVLDPFLGSGTTGMIAEYLGRNWVGIELKEEYAEIARSRIAAGYTPPKKKSERKRRRKLAVSQRELFATEEGNHGRH